MLSRIMLNFWILKKYPFGYASDAVAQITWMIMAQSVLLAIKLLIIFKEI